MTIALNHTLVYCRDKHASSEDFAALFGLATPGTFGPFRVVALSNGVNLEFHQIDGQIPSQHYAFLVSEGEFDEVFGRILDAGLAHWADPMCQCAGTINHHDGGRGVYFPSPDGHLLEIITRPYGG